MCVSFAWNVDAHFIVHMLPKTIAFAFLVVSCNPEIRIEIYFYLIMKEFECYLGLLRFFNFLLCVVGT